MGNEDPRHPAPPARRGPAARRPPESLRRCGVKASRRRSRPCCRKSSCPRGPPAPGLSIPREGVGSWEAHWSTGSFGLSTLFIHWLIVVAWRGSFGKPLQPSRNGFGEALQVREYPLLQAGDVGWVARSSRSWTLGREALPDYLKLRPLYVLHAVERVLQGTSPKGRQREGV